MSHSVEGLNGHLHIRREQKVKRIDVKDNLIPIIPCNIILNKMQLKQLIPVAEHNSAMFEVLYYKLIK